MLTFDRRIAAITFLIGVVSLMYELTQVRMLSFLLGNSMDFLAIPIALLGLAMGSMFRHFLYKGSPAALIDRLSIAVFPMMIGSFVLVFAVANTFFPEIHVAASTPPGEALKVVTYSLLFLPPYLAFGALFSTLFSAFSDKIGRLYFYDLAGAALGCVLTPLIFTFFGLPPAIMATLLVALMLFMAPERVPSSWKGGAAAAMVLVVVLGATGVLFREKPDANLLARSILRDGEITEVDFRWNEIARTSLMRSVGKNGTTHAIVQDNGLSNVTVRSYVTPLPEVDLRGSMHYGSAWLLGMEPKNILVVFAGHGRDMIVFDQHAKGGAEVTGVEINRTVVDWNSHPALAHMNLQAFHDKPNIHLENEEGRDFLNTDKGTYDLIYVANNGAVHAGRTGHTRKFLDTYEAMDAYMDRLSPDGIMVFTAQPIMEKIPSFRTIFEARGLPEASKGMYIFGPGDALLDSMILKPSGFTPEQIAILDEQLATRPGDKILAKPGMKAIPRFESLLHDPLATLPLVTDDKPFTALIDWRGFSVLPDPERYRDAPYVSGWVKIFTVLLFAMMAGLVAVGAAALGTREQRVPAVWVGYLLLSGIGYMCVEIPLIAKTELFIGNPLYAVSINLATFLIFNAIGAWLQDERRIMKGPAHLVVGVIFSAAWGVLLAELSADLLLSVPLPLKALGVAVIVCPAGIVLGTFYPYCVGRIVAAGQGASIPMTYGLTTLSSVLGSAFAMTAIINLGFTNVIILGSGLYVFAVAISLAAAKAPATA